VHGSRGRGLLAAGLTACALVAAYRALHAAPDPSLVARWWPATALVTVLFLMLPRQLARGFVFLTTTGFFAVGLLAGHDVVFSLGFAVANTVEVLVVVWWLTRFDEGVPRLHTWGDYRRWLIGICLGSAAAGLVTAGTLWVADGAHGDAPWRTLLWIAVTHGGAQALVLPLVMQQQQHRIRVSALEITLHAVLMVIGLSACIAASAGQPVAFLLLPVLMWGAARFPHLWSNLELAGVAAAFALLSAIGQGPFPDVPGRAPLLTIAASAQVFVLISAITAVAFSVATSHLRDSLRRLRENELQLGQLLDSASGTAFIATDLEGVITWFSPGAEQLLGYRAEDLVGRATPIQFHEPRELISRARSLGIPATTYEVITAPLQRGEEQDTRDWTYVRPDGGRLTVSLSVTAVRDDAGRPQSYLSVVRDVTDRRAAEQALLAALDKEREANRRMHEVDRAKDDFVSSVSHELRTPLTSIVGYTELLTDGLTGAMTAMQTDLVEKIDRNGERLLNLVEDLLTLSRVENGSFRLERTPTDLRDAVHAGTAEVTSAAQRQGVAMSVIVPPEPVMVVGDSHHLERLVLNLVSNAVKFTDRGGSVRVGLEVQHETAVLSVSDTGMGIPFEEQPNLFQRFFRSSVATERAIQGTGLGLNIAQSIAKAHQGSVAFESTPGVGTTFRFTVPLKGPQPLAAETQPVQDRKPTNRAVENLFSPRHRSTGPRSEVS
jgi:PAS domain S-box-containing protein